MLELRGGRTLLADGTETVASITIDEGVIRAIGGPSNAPRCFDATGLHILPGIVDLHGDAFERQLQPRPGVDFPVPLALRDTEAQLLANGITTAMHAITLSWEPGLRSPERWRQIVDALEAARPTSICDMRVHMRWEMHNLPALDMALEDIEAGRVGLVSYNDHTPSIVRKMAKPETAAKYSERAGMSVTEFLALAEAASDHAPHVGSASVRLAEAARRRGLPMASHDDDAIETRDRFRALGARICEFPMAEAVGLAAREAGDAVVMGCPNVVRGGSHLGWASAASLAERDICTVLCSDYYYPAMLPAAWSLARTIGLGRAWALIAQNPAAAAGLEDRGVIAEGKRADVVLVDPDGPRVVATVAAGQIGFMSGAAWRRWDAQDFDGRARVGNGQHRG